MRLPLLTILLAIASASCSNPVPPAAPASFDRPESVSFFCWNKTEGEVVPLGECAPDPEQEGDDVGRPPEPFELHAVVTQTASGEAAAVQVTTDTVGDTSGVVDSDVRLPGFTFAAVGEVPSAVVTPRDDPEFTYVVNRGSSDLYVVETATFRSGLGAIVTVYDADALGWDRLSRPSAMVLTPDEDALIVALPEQGQIARVAIDGATVMPAEILDLEALVPAPVDLSVLDPADRPPEYVYTCGDPELTETVWAPPRDPVIPADAAPEPWALAIDDEQGTVLVADRGLPIIHVVDFEALVEGAPISVSVPTRDVVLSPRVPALVGGTDPTERFVYAIDEIERTVLVVDYSDPARASFGGVLSVRSVAPYDRLTLPEVQAQALEVVAPAYDAGDLTFCSDTDESSPLQLHGVFLTVACSDGRVRFYDIFDLDTTCRGTGDADANCSVDSDVPDRDTGDDVVAIARHRPRTGQFVSEPVQVTPQPRWELGGARIDLDDDGTNSQTDELPAFVALDACTAPLAPVFPADGAPLVCALTDPFVARPQLVALQYEGVIPGTSSSGGNVEGAAIHVRFDPCERGVIGADDVPAAGSLAGYAGDVIAITGPLPPSLGEEEREYCADLLDETDALETTPLLFRVARAFREGTGPYSGRIELGDPLADYTAEDVARCFPELLSFEVRVSGVFLVSSSQHGYLHPITADAGGACIVDPAREAELQNGRAFFEREFTAPYTMFRLGGRPSLIEDAAIGFQIGDVPAPLALDVGSGATESSLLVELVFNDIDQRLYVIDQSVSGLVRVRLTDLAAQGRFR